MGNPIILLEVISINGNALSAPTNYPIVVNNMSNMAPSGSGTAIQYRKLQAAPATYIVSQSPTDIVALAASETPSEIIDSITASITAFAGGGQGSAVQLTSTVNNITTVATAGDSVKLPEAIAGLVVIVQNNGANAADVFPATGETINGGSANAAVSLPAGARMEFIGTTTTNWTTDRGYALISDIIASKEVDHVISVTATSTAATAGGAMTITAGTSGTSGTGGVVALNGGIGGTTGAGGAINITSGAGGSSSGASGAVNVKSANETGAEVSGAITLASGTTASATSGAVTVATGANSTSGDSGVLTLASGASSTSGNTGTANVRSGNAASGTSGIVTVGSGTGTTASGKTSIITGAATTTTGLVEIVTGNATTTSGAVNLTTGTATTTTGAITLSTGAATTTAGAITLTTGAAVTAGNITLAPGASSSTTVAPVVIVSGNKVTKPASAPFFLIGTTASDGAFAKAIVGGYVEIRGATGNVQLPTGAMLTTAIGTVTSGTSFLCVFNAIGATPMTAGNTATITTNTNAVLDASADQDIMTITGTSNVNIGTFRFVWDSTNWIVSRV